MPDTDPLDYLHDVFRALRQRRHDREFRCLGRDAIDRMIREDDTAIADLVTLGITAIRRQSPGGVIAGQSYYDGPDGSVWSFACGDFTELAVRRSLEIPVGGGADAESGPEPATDTPDQPYQINGVSAARLAAVRASVAGRLADAATAVDYHPRPILGGPATVADVVVLLESGATPEDIRRMMPGLSPGDIEECRAWMADRAEKAVGATSSSAPIAKARGLLE